MLSVDGTRLDLARQFKASPFGPHGAELQRLLELLRWEPVVGRFVLVEPEQGGPFYLALWPEARRVGCSGSDRGRLLGDY